MKASLILVVTLSLFIQGCGDIDVSKNWRTTCVDEVEYITYTSGGGSGYMAPHFKPDGSLYTCGISELREVKLSD